MYSTKMCDVNRYIVHKMYCTIKCNVQPNVHNVVYSTILKYKQVYTELYPCAILL